MSLVKSHLPRSARNEWSLTHRSKILIFHHFKEFEIAWKEIVRVSRCFLIFAASVVVTIVIPFSISIYTQYFKVNFHGQIVQ